MEERGCGGLTGTDAEYLTIIYKLAAAKISHNSQVFGGKKRHPFDREKWIKTMKIRAFAFFCRRFWQNNWGDPPGGGKNHCFTLHYLADSLDVL